MRVADRSSARNYLKYLNNAKNAYAKTDLQIASGNRFEKLSDDVASGTRVLRTRMDLCKAEKHLDNVKSINEELGMAEDVMMDMQDILKDVHGLIVEGMSEEKGESGRQALANEVKALREQFLNLMNSKYNQRYTFGGSNASLTAPFSADKDGNLLYNGIDVNNIMQDADGYYYTDEHGDRQNIPMDEKVYMDIGLGLRMKESQVEDGSGFLVSFSGLDIVGFGKSADGLSNNIYNILTQVEDKLRNYDKETLGNLSTQLTTLTDRFTGHVTDIGSRTKFLDTMQDRLTSNVDSYKVRIDNLMGTNDREAAMQLSMNDYTLKAVLQMGSRVLPTSLMDFLR